MSKSDDVRVSLIAEATPGTTPTDPAFINMRLLSDTLVEESESENSAELGGNVGVTAQIDGGRRVTGDVNGYLIANDAFELMLESVFGSTWAADQLVPGKDVKTFTYEKSLKLAPVARRIQRFTGLGFGSWQLELAAQRVEHRRDHLLDIPTTKSGKPRTIPLSERARDILDGLPATNSGSTWGMRPDSITQAWNRACKAAGVVDLRFHDTRHEGTSRLFEGRTFGRPLSIPEAALITGHSTWSQLQRYTQLSPDSILAVQ